MRRAITRGVSSALARCELTHLARAPIDVSAARGQHDAYERRLREAGCAVTRVDADEALPDCVFVEDIALVLPDVAILTRPGAASRRGETPAIEAALRPYRALRRLEAPATLDGGDVLVVGRAIYVGRSSRTNDDGIAQLRALVAPLGYALHAVAVRGCLHLKSAVTAIGDDVVLLDPASIDGAALGALRRVEIDPAEPGAANALRVGDALVYPSSFPRTRARLAAHGARILDVDVGELQKAEGAVTCCSLIFSA